MTLAILHMQTILQALTAMRGSSRNSSIAQGAGQRHPRGRPERRQSIDRHDAALPTRVVETEQSAQNLLVEFDLGHPRIIASMRL